MVFLSDFQELTVVRHGQSVLNELHKGKATDKFYQAFKNLYKKSPDSLVTRLLAGMVRHRYSHNVADSKASLTEEGKRQSELTGAGLQDVISLPDVIFVSPYARTLETLECMMKGWPELRNVEVVEEELLREIEPGAAVIYGDFDIFLALNPKLKRVCDLEGMYRFRFPGAENGPDVRQRCRIWYADALRSYEGKRVLAITHSYTKTALRANLEGCAEEDFGFDVTGKMPNCATTSYRYSDESKKIVLDPDIDNKTFYNK